MLIRGVSELNLLQGFDDSLQNFLTQTMLNQEEIFKNQVLELHRLYRIQKILMKGFDFKVGGGINFGKERQNSFVSSVTNRLEHESLATEIKLGETPTTCTPQYAKDVLRQPAQRSIDLELPASYYINESEELKNPFNQGFRQHQGELTGRRLFTSDEMVDLDLNKPLSDESYFHSIPSNLEFTGLMINCSNDQSVQDKKNSTSVEKSGEDIMVNKGAVSLLYFSSCVPETGEIIERDFPQCSSESYESIVLKKPEISLEDYSHVSSSTSFEASCLNDIKDNNVKWRRGRRMKDFRKEILPELTSLTRQEIREDVRIMELAIRSREYKKYSSKIATSECYSQVRNKRSRLGRRRS